MRPTIKLSMTAALLGGALLTGCVESTGGSRSSTAAHSGARAPENAAERACTQALASQLGGGVRAGDLSIISTDMSQGELWITVHVPSAEQPWACVLDRNGRVTRTQYMGEG